MGLKETKEVIDALAVLKKVLMAHLADGFQIDDVKAILEDLSEPAAKQEILEAIAGIEQVLPEVKEMSLFEKIDLAMYALKVLV